jgi:predicted RNA binding protein YcfA (HicA-like mRNA interferase family)
MKLPRDLSAEALVKHLGKYGYGVTRQTGSHIRLTTTEGGEHHITIPAHGSLRVGTLNSILIDVANHLKKSKDEILKELFE